MFVYLKSLNLQKDLYTTCTIDIRKSILIFKLISSEV
jgi:hypothetical protein